MATIYPAAALFNGRETFFNAALVDGLEKKGHLAKFPQRDGFEFGNLHTALTDVLPVQQVSDAVQNVIYFLDMGVFIPESDVIIANVDEPLDEGLVVELCHGKNLGLYNIGLRTDARSPFGPSDSRYGGMHFFPAYQCHEFVRYSMPAKTWKEGKEQMDRLIDTLDRRVRAAQLPARKVDTTGISEAAKLLFHGIEDIHSPTGLSIIAQRYVKNSEVLARYAPKCIVL